MSRMDPVWASIFIRSSVPRRALNTPSSPVRKSSTLFLRARSLLRSGADRLRPANSVW